MQHEFERFHKSPTIWINLIPILIFTALGKEEHNRQQGQPKQRNQERAH